MGAFLWIWFLEALAYTTDLFTGQYTMDDILASMSAAQIAFVTLGVLFAALMRAFSGFGFALMAVPVFSLFLVPGDAVVLSALLTLLVSGITYKAWFGKYPTELMPPSVAGSIVGTGIGVYFLSSLSVEQFQLWIGLSVIVACVLLSRFKPRESAGSPALAGVVGVGSGLMNGAFAIPGPPVIVYVMATIHDPVKSRAFLMAFFIASNAISLMMFWIAGLVTSTPFYLLLVAFPVMLLGDRLGAWLFLRVGGQAYRPVALIVSLSVGVAITAKALWG